MYISFLFCIVQSDRRCARLLEESRVGRAGSVGWLRVLPTGRIARLSNRWLHPFVCSDNLARPVHYKYYYYLSLFLRGRHNAIYEFIFSLLLLYYFYIITMGIASEMGSAMRATTRGTDGQEDRFARVGARISDGPGCRIE